MSELAPGARTEALRWTVLGLLGLLGSGIAAYLTYAHWADRVAECAGIGQCELVQTSEYSDIGGVPVALLGLLYFLGLTAAAGARLRRHPLALEWGQPAVLGAALAATAFVVYLTYVELFVLEAICIWCVSLASVTVVTLAVTVWGALDEG